MPDSIDWPPTHSRTQLPRRPRRFLLILAILAGIFFGGRTALSYSVDVLWFRSLGYGEVFWKTLSLQWGIFAVFAAATFLILFGSFLALKRAYLPDLPSGHISHSVRFLPSSEAGTSLRFAKRSYDSHRRTTGEAAG